jgi:hypothetical protein
MRRSRNAGLLARDCRAAVARAQLVRQCAHGLGCRERRMFGPQCTDACKQACHASLLHAIAAAYHAWHRARHLPLHVAQPSSGAASCRGCSPRASQPDVLHSRHARAHSRYACTTNGHACTEDREPCAALRATARRRQPPRLNKAGAPVRREPRAARHAQGAASAATGREGPLLGCRGRGGGPVAALWAPGPGEFQRARGRGGRGGASEGAAQALPVGKAVAAAEDRPGLWWDPPRAPCCIRPPRRRC